MVEMLDSICEEEGTRGFSNIAKTMDLDDWALTIHLWYHSRTADVHSRAFAVYC